MELNAEDDRYVDEEEERRKRQRPPSSYGSMKSDSDEEEKDHEASEPDEDDMGESQCDEEVAGVFNRPEPVYDGTGVQMNRPASPETLYTMTTMQTKPPGALVIETSASDIENISEDDEEEEDCIMITNSPEPPEPIELEDETPQDINGQPGKLHPEQDLPHVFRNIQKTLTDLSKEELYKFKVHFTLRASSDISLPQMFDGDLLDFVDRIIEKFGLELSLSSTIDTLENITKDKEAEELRDICKKAMIRHSLKQVIIRNCQFIFEAIPEAGKRSPIDQVYIEPEIFLCTCGGVSSSREFRNPTQTSVQSPHPESAVSLQNMFRMQKPDGRPVRTVVTTGLPGVGMTISVEKYCYDWAEQRVNKDLQYVITLPFSSLWMLRNRNLSSSTEMSIMDVIEYLHSLCKKRKYLDDEDCKYLIIMDSFDCYQTLLDWKNTPIISSSQTPAKLDDLIVNLVRGTLLPKAQVWILGRRAAVSQIPLEFIDAFTEIHGFNQEMRDNYLRRRSQNEESAARVIYRYKQLPTLCILTQQPFICWMVSEIFECNFKKIHGYGISPPKLTPFCVNTLVVQTNRRLSFYYNKPDSNMNWPDDTKKMLCNLGKLAFTMLGHNTPEFDVKDIKEHSLDVMDVTVFSGLCTELPPTSPGKRRFCFIHAALQEFMAALYVFVLFREESINAIGFGKGNSLASTLLSSQPRVKTSVELLLSALNLTFNSPLGQYDMFLRFLCGLISTTNNRTLGGNIYRRNQNIDASIYSPEVRELLKKTVQTCPADRKENLEECLREMTQPDN